MRFTAAASEAVHSVLYVIPRIMTSRTMEVTRNDWLLSCTIVLMWRMKSDVRSIATANPKLCWRSTSNIAPSSNSVQHTALHLLIRDSRETNSPVKEHFLLASA